MKHFLLALLLFISTLSNAQTWQGIKIGSSYDVVKSQLIQKGYKYIANTSNSYLFLCDKAENSQVLVSVNPNTKIVYHLYIHVYKSDNWAILKSEFDKISDILTEKYTKDGFEMSFTYPFDEPKSDYERLTALKTGHATIYRAFRDENGKTIMLSIAYPSKETAITISYIDNDLYNEYKELEKKEMKNQY